MASQKNNRKEQPRSHIPFRLNLLFFIIFLLFVALIVRTGYLQIIKGEEFQAEVERTESTVVRGNVPRGGIYDSKLRPLVVNEASNSIQYLRGANSKVENMADVAYNLATLIDIPHTTPFDEERSDLTIRDLKDYFYATHREEVDERVTEHLRENNISANDFTYNDTLELIEDAELLQFDDMELKAAAIFTKMNGAYALSTVTIKNQDVTHEEMAKVNEHASNLPGITTGMDWERSYPQKSTLSSILGVVTSEEQGIPQTDENAYLAKGYSRNDRVGTSQLEKQYETILRGSKSRSSTETDTQGDIISQEVVHNGNEGNNLVLTIDLDFQEKLDQIVVETLNKGVGLNDRVYAVAIDPNNGNILGMSGKERRDGQIVDNPIGTVLNSYQMGSSVKGATVLTGYMTETISLDNNTILDERLRFYGNANNISSVFNRFGRVYVNDITSIQYSSNVYMSQIAMRIGGYWNYQPNEFVPIDAQETTEVMRKYFRQFGLGSETGIDLPSEEIGLSSIADNPGQAMFFTFGQFDTYTPMQLAQYSATIANGGTRYAPRLVSQIRSTNAETGEIGRLVTEIEPKIMNYIDVSPEAMRRVQMGHYQVVNGDYGPSPRIYSDAPYVIAGKTGTAEAQYWDDDLQRITADVTNLTFIGYAPYENPEIAIALVIPSLPVNYRESINVEMSRQIFDAYFKVGRFAETNESDESEDSNEENEDNENEE